MTVYLVRVILVDGSDDLLKVIAEADECTKVVQELGDEFWVYMNYEMYWGAPESLQLEVVDNLLSS